MFYCVDNPLWHILSIYPYTDTNAEDIQNELCDHHPTAKIVKVTYEPATFSTEQETPSATCLFNIVGNVNLGKTFATLALFSNMNKECIHETDSGETPGESFLQNYHSGQPTFCVIGNKPHCDHEYPFKDGEDLRFTEIQAEESCFLHATLMDGTTVDIPIKKPYELTSSWLRTVTQITGKPTFRFCDSEQELPIGSILNEERDDYIIIFEDTRYTWLRLVGYLKRIENVNVHTSQGSSVEEDVFINLYTVDDEENDPDQIRIICMEWTTGECGSGWTTASWIRISTESTTIDSLPDKMVKTPQNRFRVLPPQGYYDDSDHYEEQDSNFEVMLFDSDTQNEVSLVSASCDGCDYYPSAYMKFEEHYLSEEEEEDESDESDEDDDDEKEDDEKENDEKENEEEEKEEELQEED